MAAAILITVALTAPTSNPSRSSPGPLAGWGVQSIPVITALIGDVTTVEHNTTPVGGSALGRDLIRARALPAPPDAAAASLWATTLTGLQNGWLALEAMGPAPSADQAASIRARIGTAGAGLIEIGQALPTKA